MQSTIRPPRIVATSPFWNSLAFAMPQPPYGVAPTIGQDLKKRSFGKGLIPAGSSEGGHRALQGYPPGEERDWEDGFGAKLTPPCVAHPTRRGR